MLENSESQVPGKLNSFFFNHVDHNKERDQWCDFGASALKGKWPFL